MIAEKSLKTTSPKTENVIEYIQRNFLKIGNACLILFSAIAKMYYDYNVIGPIL